MSEIMERHILVVGHPYKDGTPSRGDIENSIMYLDHDAEWLMVTLEKKGTNWSRGSEYIYGPADTQQLREENIKLIIALEDTIKVLKAELNATSGFNGAERKEKC